MRVFTSRRTIYRRQARLMVKFFLLMGVLALLTALTLILSHVRLV